MDWRTLSLPASLERSVPGGDSGEVLKDLTRDMVGKRYEVIAAVPPSLAPSGGVGDLGAGLIVGERVVPQSREASFGVWLRTSDGVVTAAFFGGAVLLFLVSVFGGWPIPWVLTALPAALFGFGMLNSYQGRPREADLARAEFFPAPGGWRIRLAFGRVRYHLVSRGLRSRAKLLDGIHAPASSSNRLT